VQFPGHLGAAHPLSASRLRRAATGQGSVTSFPKKDDKYTDCIREDYQRRLAEKGLPFAGGVSYPVPEPLHDSLQSNQARYAAPDFTRAQSGLRVRAPHASPLPLRTRPAAAARPVISLRSCSKRCRASLSAVSTIRTASSADIGPATIGAEFSPMVSST
jgi:hypothetical protein